MFIDVHAHCCKYENPFWKITTASPLLSHYDRLGIEKGFVLPLVSPEVILPQSVEEVISICGEYPDRLVPFCNIDPRTLDNSSDAKLGSLLKYYKDKGCIGIGEITANLPILDERVQNLFYYAEQEQMPVTFHLAHKERGMYGLIDKCGLPGLEKCLRNFPKLKFLGHSMMFWSEIGTFKSQDDHIGKPQYPINKEGKLLELFRQYPNLYGDLSSGSGANALMRDPVYAVKFINEFQDRLFFGMDICDPEGWISPLPGFLKELLSKGILSLEAFNKITKENALSIILNNKK